MRKKLLTAMILLTLALCGTMAAFAADAPSAWAAREIQKAVASNLVPNALQTAWTKPITRAEFCALAARVIDVSAVDIEGYYPFRDAADTAVRQMEKIGIISGKANGFFAPNDEITRQEAAAMLYRMTKAPGLRAAQTAQLVPHVWNERAGGALAPWAREAVDFCYNTGVMEGVGENRFAPLESYTVEQSVCAMLRLREWAAAGGKKSKADDRRFLFYDQAQRKYGFKDVNGTIVIPARFDGAPERTPGDLDSAEYRFEHGYAVVYQGEKRRLIDRSGKLMPLGNEDFDEIKPLSLTRCVVLFSDEDGKAQSQLLSLPDGKLLEDDFFVDWQSASAEDGSFVYTQGQQQGYLNADGSVRIRAQYAYAGAFADGVAMVWKSLDAPPMLIDTQGRVLSERSGIAMRLFVPVQARGRRVHLFAQPENRVLQFDGKLLYQATSETPCSLIFTDSGSFFVLSNPKSALYSSDGQQRLAGFVFNQQVLHGLYAVEPNEKVGKTQYAGRADGKAILVDASGTRVSAALVERNVIGDGGSVLCYTQYVSALENEVGLHADQEQWTVVLDDTGAELSRIPDAPLASFEDGALRVIRPDYTIAYYTPSGRLLCEN